MLELTRPRTSTELRDDLAMRMRTVHSTREHTDTRAPDGAPARSAHD